MKYLKQLRTTILTTSILALTACGGSGGGNPGSGNNQNQAPVAQAGSDISVNEQTIVTLTGSGTDSDGTIASYSWQQTSGTDVELSDSTAASTEFTAPTLIEAEQLTFRLTVTDNQGLSASDDVTVTVAPVNNAPIAQAGNDIDVNEQQSVTINGSGTDSDGNIVSYQWQQTSGSSVTLTDADTANVTFTAPSIDNDESLTFQLTVIDNEGLSASDSVTVNVTPTSIAPTVSAGEDITVNEITTVTLEAIASDVDGTVDTYGWAQTSGPAVFINNASRAVASFISPTVTTPQTLTFTVAVTDNDFLEATDSITVTVLPVNDVPTVSAGEDQNADAQSTVTLSGSANDGDGEIATIAWTQTQGTAVTLDDSTALSTTFIAPQVSDNETLSFTLTVTDNEGASVSDSVDITVKPVVELPQVNAGNDLKVLPNQAVTLAGSGSDSNGEIVQYQWTQIQGTTVTLNNADTATASFIAPEQTGLLIFELQVTNNQGTTASDTVTIEVTENTGFQLVDSEQQATQYPPGTSLTWSVENYDSANHTLLWEVTTNAPIQYDTLGSSIQNPHSITFTTLLVGQDTDVTVKVTLNDGTENHTMSRTITMLAQGNVKFDMRRNSPERMISPEKTIVMDISGDGIDDIITKDNITLGSTTGELNVKHISSGIEATEFSIADMNSDGLPDILFSNDSQISWSLNSSDGNPFTQYEVVNLPAHVSSSSTQAGDFDGDGDTDLAYVYSSEHTMSLGWQERENGILKDLVVIDEDLIGWSTPGSDAILAVGNFQNNGKTDIFVATQSINDTRPNYVFSHTSNTTNGGFTRSTAFNLGGGNMYASYNTRSLTVSDLNQDGFDDIVIWQSGTSFNNDDASSFYFLSDKDGSFTGRLLHHSFDTSFGWNTIDIDGDGDLDIIHGNSKGDFYGDIGSSAANSFAGALIWYENLGDSFSTDKKVIMYDDNANLINIGDFDNDGDIDLNGNNWYAENKLDEADGQNQAPTASAGDDITVNEKANVTINGSGSDSDGTIATYRWDVLNGANVILTSTSNATTGFTAPTVTHAEIITLQLTVIDDKGLRAIDTVTITVNPINEAPNASAGADQTVDEQSEVTLNGSGTDPDNNLASYSWTQTSGTSVSLTNASSATASFTAPTLTASEQLIFELTVTDSEGLTATDSVTITVNPVNTAPTANAGDDITANEQTSITLNGSGTDTDGSIASYSWAQSAGTSVSLNGANSSSISFTTPTITIAETLTFTLTVTDNEGLSASDNVTVSVSPVNTAPIANAGSDITADEQTVVTLNGSATDSDGSITSYSWSQSAGTSVTLNGADSASVSFTAPTTTATETLTFTLTVTDNEGLSASDNVTVSVNPVNSAPIANAGNDQIVDEQTQVTLSGSGSDSDGSIASYSWQQLSGTTVSLTDTNSASTSFTAPILTSSVDLTFALTVTDNEGATHSDNVIVTVNPLSTAPTANAGDDITTNEQTAITLVGSGEDSDGTIASYNWQQTEGPTATISKPDSSQLGVTTPTVTKTENLVFELIVTDDSGLAGIDSVTVTVLPVNSLPSVNAGDDQRVAKQTSVTLMGSATDSDGSIASVMWTQTAGSSVTLSDATALSTAFTAPNSSVDETLTFTLTATDNEGASTTDSIDVTVISNNAAPVAEAGNEQYAAMEQLVYLNGSGTDSDGSIVSYQWTQTAGSSINIANSNSASARIWTPKEVGMLTFELQVTDNLGTTATDTVNINVLPASEYLLVDSQQQASEYGPATKLKWTVVNSDPEAHTLTWRVTTDAPIVTDNYGDWPQTQSNPSGIEFTTLPVHQDTTVKIDVTLNDGSQNHVMSKTITMLAQGSVTFVPNQRENTDALTYLSSASDSTVMDITGDGFNDIITGSKLAVGSATGDFTVSDLFADFTASREYSIADINNDGLKDILLTSDSKLAWSANSSDDTRFNQYTTFTTPENAVGLSARAGDFDGDSDTDIVISYEVGSDNIPKLAWYEQDNGSFKNFVVIDEQINEYDHQDRIPMLTVGDFDNDGKTEIIVATSTTNDWRQSVLYDLDGSSFAKSTAFYLTGSSTYSGYYTRGIKTMDINQDGYDDIVTWQSGYSYYYNYNVEAYYHINNQDGTFTRTRVYSDYGTEIDVRTVDMDNDGDLDIILGHNEGSFNCDIGCTRWIRTKGKVLWKENLGGTFSSENKVLINSNRAYYLHAGDFDNDGDTDVINSNESGDAIWYNENKLN